MSILLRPLILASTSSYRRNILAKLCLPFTQVSPDYAEVGLPGESPYVMARRFAAGKALAVSSIGVYESPIEPPIERPIQESMEARVPTLSRRHAHDAPHLAPLVIGSDQVVCVNGERLSKPGTAERAQAQLSHCSGQWVTYCSALSLATEGQTLTLEHELYHVKFRKLKALEIQRYVALDKPLDCAGSIKAEGLGITLFSSTRGNDINTLYGLPLLRLAQRLREYGLDALNIL